ncbi:MAG: YlxR family protein [Eubacterium sp.]|nr:YlxR family protein [Eubacterium sp.]
MGQTTKKIPTRTCTGCREEKNKKELIRIVRDKDGNVFVDMTGKQNGRGAYICPNRQCLEKALKNRGLERTLKISKISDEVKSQLMEQLGEGNE